MLRSIVTTAPNATLSLPALLSPTADASRRFVEFFTVNIRNPNTRKAYARAASQFATWCEEVEPICTTSNRSMLLPMLESNLTPRIRENSDAATAVKQYVVKCFVVG